MSAPKPTQQEDLTTASKGKVIEALPKGETELATRGVVLEFTGEAWINEQARDIDGKETTFTIPLTDLHQNGEWALDETPCRHFVSDSLHTHENAPKWVQEWDGPFELQVKHWTQQPPEQPRDDVESTPLPLDEEDELYGYGILNVRRNQFVSPLGRPSGQGDIFTDSDELVEYYRELAEEQESVSHLRIVQVRLDNTVDQEATEAATSNG